jgi:hypothetical protein
MVGTIYIGESKMTNAAKVIDLNAPAFPSLMEIMALPGGWVEPKDEEVEVFQISPFTFGQNYFLKGGDLSVFLNGPSDGNNITIKGDVDELVNHDGWYNDWKIFGNVESISVSSSIGTSVSAYSAGYASAFQSSGLDLSFTTVDHLSFQNVNDSSVDAFIIGEADIEGNGNYVETFYAGSVRFDGNNIEASFVILDEGESTGNNNSVEIGTLTQSYEINGGHGQTLTVGNAVGATVHVASDATDTSLQVEQGGVIFDNGNSTSFVGGEGDQIVFANGDGISMYNGGNSLLGELLGIPDGDTVVDNGGGVDIFSGFSSVSVDTEGDVFIFDPQKLEEATLQLGQHDVDIDDLMPVFGKQDGNDAVLNFNGGSVTLVGAAGDYFEPEQQFVPLDDFLMVA